MRVMIAMAAWLLLLLPAALLDASSGAWAWQVLPYFVDLPTLFYVLLPAFAVTVALCTWQELVMGVAVALGLAPAAPREALIRGARALHLLARTAWATGCAVFLIQVIVSAHNSASMLMFLPALGVSALALLYGLALSLLCLLAMQAARRRLGDYVFFDD